MSNIYLLTLLPIFGWTLIPLGIIGIAMAIISIQVKKRKNAISKKSLITTAIATTLLTAIIFWPIAIPFAIFWGIFIHEKYTASRKEYDE